MPAETPAFCRSKAKKTRWNRFVSRKVTYLPQIATAQAGVFSIAEALS